MPNTYIHELVRSISDPVIDCTLTLFEELGLSVMEEALGRLELEDVLSFNARFRKLIPSTLSIAFDRGPSNYEPAVVEELQRTFGEYASALTFERIVTDFNPVTGWLSIQLFESRLAAALKAELAIETSGRIFLAFNDGLQKIAMPALPNEIDQLLRYSEIVARVWRAPVARALLWP